METTTISSKVSEKQIAGVKTGDLVRFSPDTSWGTTLTAIKYYERINKRIGGITGIVVSINSNNATVAFNNDIIILHISYLTIISEGGENASKEG